MRVASAPSVSIRRRREVIDIAVRAARPIGDGFYGVDLKQTDHGIVVMEVNDNPSLEHGIEDTIGKDEIWTRLLSGSSTASSSDVIPGHAKREPGIHNPRSANMDSGLAAARRSGMTKTAA